MAIIQGTNEKTLVGSGCVHCWSGQSHICAFLLLTSRFQRMVQMSPAPVARRINQLASHRADTRIASLRESWPVNR